MGSSFHIDSSEGTFVFNVHGLAPTELCKMLGSIAHEIDMWWAEGIQAAMEHEVERQVLEEEGDGYALSDPKSPGYHDRMVGDA